MFLSTIISVLIIITTAVSLVFIYEDEVIALMIKEINKHLNCEVRVEPKDIDLTIIQSFPNCAIEFKNLTAFESKDYKTKDTLLSAKKLALAFNIKDLFNKRYDIKKIYLSDAKANIKFDKKGNPNFKIWKSNNTPSSSDSLTFKLEDIVINNCYVNYKDNKRKFKYKSHIEKLSFKGNFSETHYTLSTNGNAFVNYFQQQEVKYLKDKHLKFDLEFDVNGSTYTVIKSETAINKTILVSHGSFVIQDSLLSLDINYSGKNLDISTTLSLLPDKFKAQINDYESDGEFYASGECHYKNGQALQIKSDFGIKKANITHKQSGTNLSEVNLLGKIVFNETRTILSLRDINAKLNNNHFTGNVEITNFSNPYLKLDVAANTSLQDVMTFYPIDTLENLSGNIKLQAQLEGLLSEIKSNANSQGVQASGKAEVQDLKAKFKHSDKEINIPQGEVTLYNRGLSVNNLKLIKGKSDLNLVGELPGFLAYVFNPSEPLIVKAMVQSQNIEVEDFIFSSGKSHEKTSISIAPNLDINVNLNIEHLTFGKFIADKFQGNLLLRNQKIALHQASINTMDGNILLNAIADASGEHIKISGESELKQLNIQKLFSQLNNFGQTSIIDKNLKGFASANVDFSATWNKQLEVDVSSINVTSSLLIERGELIGFKPLENLAKYIDVNELKHIKFSTLQSAVEIKNKIIAIPKTSIKSTAINLELWGKHTFDNMIDYHIRLLLSEIIAKRPNRNKDFDEELSLVENDPENRRSVFIVMTGPMDNPTIKYDKKGAKEKIKEDIRQEKQNLKQILKEEFGFFKKDSSLIKKDNEHSNQRFQIEIGEEKVTPKKTLQPKKKEDEEDDF